jgi:hypothetical protein
MKPIFIFLFVFFGIATQNIQSQSQQDIYDMIAAVSASNIEKDITTLTHFGTRHTLSDTLSDTRGIGAARRWIKKEFETISKNCGNCLEVYYQKNLVKKGENNRITKDVWVVNVVAILRGNKNPNHFVMMSGDIDSRISDPNNYTDDAPGANDNASGMAGVLEAARVLSKYTFDNSIVFLGLSGEEQGLFGGKGFANYAKNNNWNIIGVLNNDMIGNIKGVDGVISNREFRIFSEPVPPTETEKQRKARRFYGGEIDGISRQLARYVYKTTKKYMPEMKPMLIYRLDRFGRGGHHRPFNDLGFAGIRIMEAHENYTQQHQDVRTQNGIEYGDKLKFVDFNYAAKLTTVNIISLASLAWAPLAPENVKIGGMVSADTHLQWDSQKGAAYYKAYWRETISPFWDISKPVYNATSVTLKGFVIDNYLYGVASVGKNGFESLVSFPTEVLR